MKTIINTNNNATPEEKERFLKALTLATDLVVKKGIKEPLLITYIESEEDDNGQKTSP